MPAKASTEELEKAIKKYLSGEGRAVEMAGRLGIHRNNFYKWVKKYCTKGVEGLRYTPGKRYIEKNPVYLPEIKEAAVLAYQAGEGSQRNICKRFKIGSTHTLATWVKVYNSGKNFKHGNGGSRMTKARNTTHEERIQIVKECLESGKDYGGIAQKYAVSYQQVYTWVKKFEEKGEAGLEDRRGQRTRQQAPRTAEEGYKARIAQLEHELYMTRMERDLLKKVKELERRDRWGK